MRLVPVGSLKSGTVIAKTIYNDSGNTLLKQGGVPLTESLIDKLQSNDIISIYIEDDYSLGEIQDVISPELRSKAVKEVKKVFDSVQRELRNQILDTKKIIKTVSKRD